MWIVFGAAALVVQKLLWMLTLTTGWGRALSNALDGSFMKSYLFFSILLPLVALGVLLLCGVHPPWACASAGLMMIVNGVRTGLTVQVESFD